MRNTTELLISDQPADNQLLQVGMMMNSTAQSHQFYFHSNHDETSHFKDYNGTSYDCSDGDTLAVHSMVDYITYSTVDIAKPVLSTSDNGKNLIWSISNNPNVKNNVKYNVRRDGNKVNLTDIEATQWDITNNYGTHTWQIEVFPTSASIVRNEAFYSGSGETVPYLNKVFLQIPRVTVNNRLSNTITTYQTETPTITPINVTLPDEYEFSVSSTGATYYKYAIDNNALSGYIPIANRTKVSNLAYGNHTVTVFVYADNQGHGASVTTRSFSLTALLAPSGLSFSRTTVDGGIFTYTLLQNLPANSYKFKISLNNGAWVDNSNNTSYNISGGELGNNIVVVVLEYYNNGVHKSDFDSSASLRFELTKLQKPVAIGLENYNSNGGVRYIKMQWGAVNYAVDYVIRDIVQYTDQHGDIVEDTHYYDNSGNDGLSALIYGQDPLLSGIPLTQYGLHRFTVQAKASGLGDSVFDSMWSEIGPNLEFEIHVLKAPVIAWKSASTGLLSQESTLMWATPTDPDDENNIPDYYFVNMNAAVDGTRLLFGTIPNDTENGMEYNIVDNLLPNPTSTYSYVINVIPNSYNTLYYQPTDTSISNNLEYSVIKLATPTNIAYDIDHQTISWDNITNANIYYVYEINENNLSILWGTSDTNSFEFDTPLDAGLHYFYVVAGRISYEED